MLMDYTISIYNRLPSTKVNGITIPGALSFIRDIDADMQPYSTALLLKQYGFNIEVTKRFFLEDIADINIGTILQYGTEKYEVEKIIPWDNYYDVMTLEVI